MLCQSYKSSSACNTRVSVRCSALRRLACSAAAHCNQQASLDVLEPLDLFNRTTAILWDLDNIRPSPLASKLVPAVTELQDLLLSWNGRVATTMLYANSITHSQLGHQLIQQLAQHSISVAKVEARNQAADMQLTADAFTFARSHGKQGCVVCVSSDTDFGPILSYISSLGVYTIIVAAFPSKKQFPTLLPDLTKHPVAQFCDAALSWQPLPAAASSSRGQLSGDGGSSGKWVVRGPLGTRSGWHLLPQIDPKPGMHGVVESDAAVEPIAGCRSYFEALWVKQRVHSRG